MNDRELLERAAKAAGYEFISYHVPQQDTMARLSTTWGGAWAEVKKPEAPIGACRWNPLTDDGDAFRLAAYLDLFSGPGYWHHLAIVRLSGNTDKYANVRRAIVRMAADIGKQMSKPIPPAA